MYFFLRAKRCSRGWEGKPNLPIFLKQKLCQVSGLIERIGAAPPEAPLDCQRSALGSALPSLHLTNGAETMELEEGTKMEVEELEPRGLRAGVKSHRF